MARHGAGGVVEFLEHVVARHVVVADGGGEVAAEGFDYGEIDAARLGVDGVALYKVEDAVAANLVVVVEAVEAQEGYDFLVLHARLWQVAEVNARSVAEQLHVEFEVVALHRGGPQRVHVFHHQVPVAHLRGAGRAAQRFDQERLLVVGTVGGEFAHLVRYAAVGVFVSHAQHLVSLQRRFERYVA